MGDGRYYTITQFSSVVWLTILILATVTTLLNSFYKIEKWRRLIGFSGVALTLALMSHFVAAVIHIISEIEFWHSIKTLFLALYIALISYYYFISLFKFKKLHSKLSSLSLILLVIGCLLLATVPFWWLTYAIFVIQYTLLSNQIAADSLGINLFTNIKRMVLDYVVIIDVKGYLVYASEQTSGAAFFNLNSKMNLNDIGSFFIGDVVIRQSFNKQFIRLKNDQTRYFQFHKKAIYSNNKLGGYILTFVDITELIAMLDDYEAKREAVFKSNVRLRRYRDRVYRIEREKEVNHLLREIAQNQEKALAELATAIDQLSIDSTAFQATIKQLIARAKSNLSDVRQAVTAYKNYYGKGE